MTTQQIQPQKRRTTDGFKDFIDREKIYNLINEKPPATEEIDKVLAKASLMKGLTTHEASLLLNASKVEDVQKILSTAGKVKERIYGKRLVLFAPLYVSNKCSNNCLYCAFRRENNNLKRTVLDIDAIKKETEILIDSGHKRALLIGGETDETDCSYYIEAMRAIYSVRKGSGNIRRINLEIAPLDVADFIRLKNENLGTFICFQETYDKDIYSRVHPSGPKSDFEWRLSVMDRAMQGGLGDVGIGALFGLNDYRFEVIALLEHAAHLEKMFGVGPHTISVPRIEPADCAPVSYNVPNAVSDDDFKKMLAVIRLAVPYTGIILTTREKGELRRELFKYGVSQISAGSRTNPGGYADSETGSQFSLGDHRSLDEVISTLIDDGYVPSFCTGCYRKGRVGMDFMDIAKPGLIAQYCLPNGLFTFNEFLNDYASPETKFKGKILLKNLSEKIEPENLRKLTIDNIQKIDEGERDIYL